MWFKKQEEKFRFVDDWYGEHFLTADQLFKMVQSNSKSDYILIESAPQLYQTIHLPGFPLKYAEGIMLILLNCFANCEITNRGITNYETLNKIYNELLFQDETTERIKEKYLRNMIHGVTMKTSTFLQEGEAFRKLSKEWEESTYEKYSKIKDINFEEVWKTLISEYNTFLNNARNNKLVIIENVENRKSIEAFLAKIVFKD